MARAELASLHCYTIHVRETSFNRCRIRLRKLNLVQS